MPNAYKNKVVLKDGTTLIDLTTDTVTDASHIMSGHRGHLADGSVVDGTGASESQVVSIKDVPNSTGITAEITGVPAPEGSISITTNGTHDVYNYETAVVAVPSIDVPTFSSSDGVTITCDKTYAQCLAILNGGENRAFISFAGSNPDSLAGFNDLGILKYYYVYAGALNARIDYRSNGSITISSVDTGQTLDVTSNGTYTQSDDNAWARVNVNVPTGSATIQPLTVTSNGTYTAPSGVDGYSPVTVNVSGGGGGSADPNADVIFIDYDGTVLHSYSASEFANLTEMPENPSHTGLVAQGWNWSLTDAKAQLTAYPEAGLVIGQMYITDDGKTRIYVHMEKGRLHPYLGICPNGTVVVDWGDGSSTDTLTGTSLTTVKAQGHEYASEGDYLITLEVTSGSFQFYGTSNTAYIFRKANDTTANIHRVYANCIRRVELGSNVSVENYAFNYCYSLSSITIPNLVTSIGSYAFNYCYSLSSITIPNGVTSIKTNVFYNCFSLASVTIPDGVTSIKTNAFYGCYSLSSITIPDGVTIIEGNAFNYCYSLSSVTIPDGVTSIGSSAFGGCFGMAEYHFLGTTPPTLANKNAFSSIQSDCVMYVPKGSLEAYQTASNWSNYASYMVEEE